MSGTELQRWHDPADKEVRYALAYLRQAPTVIGSAFKKDGQIDWGAVALAAASCLDVGLSPISNLHKMPVINGQVFPEAELWRVQFIRHGGRIDLLEDTDEKCTVALELGDRRPAPFTMTAAEARAINDAKAKPNALYKSDIRAMLRARVTMRAIRMYFPEVMAGPPGRYGDEISLAGGTPEKRFGGEDPDGQGEPALMVPPRSVAPDGATIPEYLREDEVDPEVRAGLLAALERLDTVDPAEYEALREYCQQIKLPNLKTPRHTVAHSVLLDRLICDAFARHELTSYTEAVDDAPES